MTILDLAQLTGVAPKWVASTGGGEYHSACPACGGTDRFFIQPFRQMRKCLGSYCCRQCGIKGDAIQFACQFLNYSFLEAAQAVNAAIDNHFRLPLLQFTHGFKPTVLRRPDNEWIKRAIEFTEISHATLLQKNEVLRYLIEVSPLTQYANTRSAILRKICFSQESIGGWIRRLIATASHVCYGCQKASSFQPSNPTVRLCALKCDDRIGTKKIGYQNTLLLQAA